MKKIVLGCAAVLLSLGLLAGCNNDDVDDKINNTGPEENEPTDDGNEGTTDTGPGPETGGSGSGIGGELPTELEGEWLLGYADGETLYYFNGKVESSYYGGVTTSDLEAVVVTATAVSGGATLTFEDGETTEYICMVESDSHHNFSWSEEPFTWKYDEVYETFVVDDSEGVAYFMGNYASTYNYQELRMSDYGYLTGEIESSNAQYPAHLYEIPTYSTPTSISITGASEVTVYERITLTATVAPEGADPSVVWSWETKESDGEVTVTSAGVVTGVVAGTVTVTATSAEYPSVSGSIDITVTAASGGVTAYKLGSCDTTNYCYYWFNGKTTGSTYLASSTEWDEAVYVYITAVEDSTENTCTLSFYDDNNNLKYITYPASSTQLTIGDAPYTWTWKENSGNGYFAASDGRFIGELTSDGSFRAYASGNLNGYPHVQPFTTKPEDPVKPENSVTLEEVSTIVSGTSYYLGAKVDDDYQLITGTVTSYKLPTTMNDLEASAQVVVTGDDSGGWTLTVGDKYIYAHVYSNSLELGTSSNHTVPDSGVNKFLFDSTTHAFYTSATGAVTTSYTYSYLEYFSGNVTLYGSNNLSFSSPAHLYQVVE